eukprot:357695-Chlamydomonas_euryale.AAC.1
MHARHAHVMLLGCAHCTRITRLCHPVLLTTSIPLTPPLIVFSRSLLSTAPPFALSLSPTSHDSPPPYRQQVDVAAIKAFAQHVMLGIAARCADHGCQQLPVHLLRANPIIVLGFAARCVEYDQQQLSEHLLRRRHFPQSGGGGDGDVSCKTLSVFLPIKAPNTLYFKRPRLWDQYTHK